MRITVHLDTFDRVNPMAFAILWLDMDARKWSREGHMGLDLPEWGTLEVDAHNTLIRGGHGTRPSCVLEGLDLDGESGPFEGETGVAQWCGGASRSAASGHWHVQCIDQETAQPEHRVFAADDEAS